jgi:hypothetical protein
MIDAEMDLLPLCLGTLALGHLARRFLEDPAVARRELQRLPPVRVATLAPGGARVTGRVVACDRPLTSLLGRQPCAFYQVQWRTLLFAHGAVYPDREVRFWVDDGTGRVLVRVPPSPPPPPEPGDETAWEVVAAIGGARTSRRLDGTDAPELRHFYDTVDPRRRSFRRTALPIAAVEGLILPDDVVTVGGYASIEFDAEGQAASHRMIPTRPTLTSAAGFRLAILKA